MQLYENPAGPGEYETNIGIGRNVPHSRLKNQPSYTFGSKRTSNVVDPGTRDIIGSKFLTPPPGNYTDIPADNIKFRKFKPVLSKKEPRFFELSNMQRIKAQCPIQYTGQDGLSSRDNLGSRYSRSGSSTSCHQMGKGPRSNWLFANAKDKGDFTQDFSRMGSIKND